MKKLIIILTIIASGCMDLDVQPKNGLTEAVAFSDSESYRLYLSKLYGSFMLTGQDGPDGDADLSIINDEGFSSYIRAYWKAQELTTDEAVISWTDAGIREMHEHSWTAGNQFVRVLYYRIFYTIALSNDFLNQSSESNLDAYGITEADRVEIRAFRNEARFIRALSYFHALDFYRSVPLLTSITSELPFQAEPKALFDFIVQELEDVEANLPDPKANQYGRADKAAVWMLQAQLYLNAEVFIGESMYDQVLTVTEKVIAAGYTLTPNYDDLFKADNHTSTEVIFAFSSDGVSSLNWGGTTFMVNAAIGGFMNDNIVDGTEKVIDGGDGTEVSLPDEGLTNYGVGGGWAGMRTTSAMLDKFQFGTPSQDPRGIFYSNGQSLEIEDIAEFQEGIAVPKFVNNTSDGTAGSNVDQVDTDFPYFRVADAYLMYAEAVVRSGNGNRATAVQLINELRERAYGDASANISDADLTTAFVMDERVRELYWEATRRRDLIRDNKFTKNYVWPWKGNEKDGIETEDFRIIFPIPSSELESNPNMVQNDPNY
ncbi:RagB/SusD family nutrient uptake outer membrane protein [Reichenbachiella sp.]|uniref:RagB/SusD family nutrient uptake outer membrane protein n=1 Tax=Reichenbachiella sp. TaxID=2184521 RepID=UPI003B593DC0